LHTVAQLYNERFARFGRDLRTVGWGSRADQVLRFDTLLRGLDPRGKTILDVGCGLGDLIPFLQERTGGDFSYIGIDVAKRLVEDAQKFHRGQDRLFFHGDVFNTDLPRVDISVLSGALSFRVKGISVYAKQTLERMYALSKEAACLNFLSKYVDYELDKNMHYNPEKILTWGLRAARKVNLYHDYPLYEFTIQLLRSEELNK
jgi:SAM-dependent methyltransferase